MEHIDCKGQLHYIDKEAEKEGIFEKITTLAQKLLHKGIRLESGGFLGNAHKYKRNTRYWQVAVTAENGKSATKGPGQAGGPHQSLFPLHCNAGIPFGDAILTLKRSIQCY